MNVYLYLSRPLRLISHNTAILIPSALTCLDLQILFWLTLLCEIKSQDELAGHQRLRLLR